jgi:hypothetical protein
MNEVNTTLEELRRALATARRVRLKKHGLQPSSAKTRPASWSCWEALQEGYHAPPGRCAD